MATVRVTAASFDATVNVPGIVVLDFWASWCAPCRAFAPIFEAAAAAHPEVTWGKVDTEAEEQLVSELGIRSLPTVAIFREGVPVFALPGALPRRTLEKLLQKVQALDMVKARQELEAQTPAAQLHAGSLPQAE